MRSWIPWSLLVALTAFVVASAVVGATTDRRQPNTRDLLSPFHTPAGSLKAIQTSAPPTLPSQAGFRGVENFCASAPLSGHVLYDGMAGNLVPRALTVAIGGLPSDSGVYVDWSNDHIRGYIIASFSTDSTGMPIPSSVNMSRRAEVPGVEMVLESVTVPPTVFGRLEPC